MTQDDRIKSQKPETFLIKLAKNVAPTESNIVKYKMHPDLDFLARCIQSNTKAESSLFGQTLLGIHVQLKALLQAAVEEESDSDFS
jgi:hypothetical protein